VVVASAEVSAAVMVPAAEVAVVLVVASAEVAAAVAVVVMLGAPVMLVIAGLSGGVVGGDHEQGIDALLRVVRSVPRVPSECPAPLGAPRSEPQKCE
jgi:hypothetical protein